MVRDMVEECGLAAFACTSGQAAHDRLTRDPDDVLALFADIGLDGSIDGIALALTTAERYPWISICVTSGQSGSRPDVLPRKARYLAKPWRAAEVLAFIEGARA